MSPGKDPLTKFTYSYSVKTYIMLCFFLYVVYILGPLENKNVKCKAKTLKLNISAQNADRTLQFQGDDISWNHAHA